MDKGYFKLWRRLRDHPIMQDGKALHVFIYCLMHAEWKEGRKVQHGHDIITLKAGQLTTGRKQISKAIRLSERKVRTALKHLSGIYEILTIKPTSLNSLIHIVNWDKYQSETTNQMTNARPMHDQRVTTSEELKNLNIKEKRETVRAPRPMLQDVQSFFKSLNSTKAEAEKFHDYYESNGWKVGNKAPMKNWEAAARNWIKRINGGVPIPAKREKKRDPACTACNAEGFLNDGNHCWCW